MRIWIALVSLLGFLIDAKALPRDDMDEIVAMMRSYARTPKGQFKFCLEGERSDVCVRYQKMHGGRYGLAVVYNEPIQEFERSEKGVYEAKLVGYTSVAMIDVGVDGVLDGMKVLYTAQTVKYKIRQNKKHQQQNYDAVLYDLYQFLKRLVREA